MFIIQNDNSDGQLLALQQQIDELRAEIERLKSADAPSSNASFAEATASSDRKDAVDARREYLRNYMRRRRAEKKKEAV